MLPICWKFSIMCIFFCPSRRPILICELTFSMFTCFMVHSQCFYFLLCCVFCCFHSVALSLIGQISSFTDHRMMAILLPPTSGAHLICYPGAFNMTTGPLHWELLQRARYSLKVCYLQWSWWLFTERLYFANEKRYLTYSAFKIIIQGVSL